MSKVAAVVALAVAVLALATPTAMAQGPNDSLPPHYVYMAERGNGLTYNWWGWIQWSDVPLLYWTDSDGILGCPSCVTLLVPMYNWEWENPELIVRRTYTRSNAQVEISYAMVMPLGFEFSPAVTMLDLSEMLWDPVREGQYWWEADIYLNGQNYWWTEEAAESSLAHELGHIRGLDERCTQNVFDMCMYCNIYGETTVMDMIFGGGDGFIEETCSGLTGPSAADMERVDAYWGSGQAFSPQLVRMGPDTVSLVWQDGAWAEEYWWVQVFVIKVVPGKWPRMYGKFYQFKDGIAGRVPYNGTTLHLDMTFAELGVGSNSHIYAILAPYFPQYSMGRTSFGGYLYVP